MGEAAPLTFQQRIQASWLQKASLPAKPLRVDPDMPRAAVEWVQAFCDRSLDDPGRGLALTGPHGIGKTTMAVHLAHYAVTKAKREALGWDAETNVYPVRPVYFTAYHDFVRDQKLLWKHEREGLVNTDEYAELDARVSAVNLESIDPRWWAKLVVLDDVGKEYRSGSGWVETELNSLLRLRHRHECPTLVTSNFAISEWEEHYGEAVASFAKEAFLEVAVLGTDRR